MTKEEALNYLIGELKFKNELDTNLIRDGYHSFGELYDHRITLFIALALAISVSDDHSKSDKVWRTPIKDGWFLMGIGINAGEQITYHLPESKWSETDFATSMHPDSYTYDGHTSADVLQRIKEL